jgi:hypothetical protein
MLERVRGNICVRWTKLVATTEEVFWLIGLDEPIMEKNILNPFLNVKKIDKKFSV